ncbi:uncharacterized protein [Diadema antillarum]|uniref:uncharacterized protein n=1 Tax=Diadema antillarum TaxID=105358 RepID=UPI003A84FE73
MNITCVNHQVCQNQTCVCSSSYYGASCEFSVVNALVIVLICILPPASWLIVCCYGVHSKQASKRVQHVNSADHSSGEEPREVVREEIIHDEGPPSYAAVLHFDSTGTYECIELDVPGPGGSISVSLELDAPPSYEDWMKNAACLAEQEAQGIQPSGEEVESIRTISGSAGSRATMAAQHVSVGVDNLACCIRDEEQC